MSDALPPLPTEGAPPPAPRRAASVQLQREGGAATDAVLMDPAHQSLAEALRIMLRLVQLGMIVLAVLFLFSGARTVKEGESGIRLLFGSVEEQDLKPGFHFSWPFPVGDLVKVQTGSSRIDEVEAFWPYLSDTQKAQPIEQMTGSNRLEPGRDGSLITADGNVAHAQWRINYRVPSESAASFARNIHPDFQTQIVRAAARRAIVHASAEMSIDQLLKEAARGEGSLAYRAQQSAQELLDRIDSGIQIEGTELLAKMPPLFARSEFDKVASAEANRKNKVEAARQEANTTLSQAAGRAWVRAIELIDEYEKAADARAGALRDRDQQAASVWEDTQRRVMTEIVTLFEGPSAGGEVALEINDAKLFRSAEVRRRQADLARFEALVQQYRENPLVTLHREWADAFRQVIARDTVQVFYLPEGVQSLEVVLNADPDLARAIEKAIGRAEMERTRQERERHFEAEQFRTSTAVEEVDAR